MAVSKKKSKPASKLKSRKLKKSPIKRTASKIKTKKSSHLKLKKKAPKAKSVANKTLHKKLKSAAKPKIKKNAKLTGNKKVSSNKKIAKNNKLTLVKAKKLKASTFRNSVKKIEKDTKAVMKPFGDLAVAIIETVDNIITGNHQDEKETKD